LVSHGGVEIGQGLHVKVAQIVASALDIELDRVFISESSTSKIPNTTGTSGSLSSDLHGMAAQDACRQLKERLEKFKEDQLKKGKEYKSWPELVNAAYFDQVNLSAQGHYGSADLTFNFNTGQGSRAFMYHTYGTACSQVELDTLTGDFNILRTDIVMDVGDSLNPTIDIGQIEGAFIQGLGLFTLEELIWGDENHLWIQPGHLYTQGPASYKIPSFVNIPMKWNVHLLKKSPNLYPTVYRSKAIGEPPLFLGSTVFFALRNAIKSAREENGVREYFVLDSPATSERVRMSCCDEFTRRFTRQGLMNNQRVDESIKDGKEEKKLEQMKITQYRPVGSY